MKTIVLKINVSNKRFADLKTSAKAWRHNSIAHYLLNFPAQVRVGCWLVSLRQAIDGRMTKKDALYVKELGKYD